MVQCMSRGYSSSNMSRNNPLKIKKRRQRWSTKTYFVIFSVIALFVYLARDITPERTLLEIDLTDQINAKSK